MDFPKTDFNQVKKVVDDIRKNLDTIDTAADELAPSLPLKVRLAIGLLDAVRKTVDVVDDLLQKA